MNDLRVFLRDLTQQTWVNFEPGQWIDQFEGRISAAMTAHAATFGGTFAFTGTAESGRVTVYSKARDVLIDFDWHTMTLEEAMGSEAAEHL
ncbi:hypothetical protein [Mycolicibacterium sp.]|uniref:hypothetical protein n=1 Tax=Mycolicibacterium sp. TaxID=2320850 RepID=UPI003560E3F8